MIDIDKDWLSSQYEPGFDAIELVVGGVNRTYRVRTGKKSFYLRLYRASGRPLSQIIAEATLLTAFPDCADVGVSRPVATADRSAHILELAYGGSFRHACLFESVDGGQIALTPAGMAQFGASIAHLHLAMPTATGGEIRILDPIAIVQDTLLALSSIPQSQKILRAIEKDYLACLQRTELHSIPAGLCHGDAWTGNARIHHGKVHFFDFDDFGHGPLVLDLGTAAWHFAHEESPNFADMFTSLISGYEKIRPLSKIELDVLPLFIGLAEARSLLFLARYCTLTDDLWAEVFQRALKVFALSRKS
ncbi:phosphotransferase [Pararhizobium sp. YC-54]|uniref:phosphotransferase enzyme family protein n=1 Tax=Pararhizobium sp. YC-54 TaxID=2986920 RepID=UPI0021F714DE|nr:phosphotransferase [Pararhizobium sp. YC-54]MCW0002155.1 phosphotransferase [Pararhizobium sp. YC-54]